MVSKAITLEAPAKVNLSLRILGKRADGFHEIETLIVPLSLADKVGVEILPGEGITIHCSDLAVPSNAATNLAGMAANAFYEHTALNTRKYHTRIEIQKRIPVGAGLGGGSSDAAAVLHALDALFETDLGVIELEKLAAQIGSDVPFFIRQQPAWCRGRGEKIQPLKTELAPLYLALVKPPFPVETADAYKRWASSRELPGIDYRLQKFQGIEFINDLERPVFEKFLFLPLLKQWLQKQAGVRVALLTGSGSTVFGVCDSALLAEKVALAAAREFQHVQIFTCETKSCYQLKF